MAVGGQKRDLGVRMDPQMRQGCADVRAAWSLFEFLRGHYDDRALSANRQDGRAALWNSRLADLNQWIAQASACVGKARPRFFDNREHSLLEQLPKMVKRQASPTRRNYLAMGSGFFENSQDRKPVPEVLEKIVSSLQQHDLLTTGDPEIDVFVNPDACQAVANSLTWMNDMGWTVRQPAQAECFRGAPRSLHAKFLFSANQGSSNNCNSPWVYLGSGNLTGPGFDNRMSANGGNLEAGVVFEPGELYWYRKSYVGDQSLVTNLLPLRWDDQSVLNDSPSALQPGPEMPMAVALFTAAPIAWVWWIQGCLQPNDSNASEYEILDDNGRPCERDERQFFRWPSPKQPMQVRARWKHEGKEWEALVPVIDEHGRIAAAPLLALEVDDAWSQLASFPMPPDEEEIPDDAGEMIPPAGASAGPSESRAAKYPVRSIMELIENIADKQSSLLKFDWGTWCARLEQCLGQAANSEIVKKFRELGLNPLSPLWHAPFRPAFAATSASPEGERYESALSGIEEKWQVADLPRIGGNHEPGIPRMGGGGQVAETSGK